MNEWWTATLGAGLTSARMESVTIEDPGDLIIELGAYSMDIAPADSPPVADVGKYVVVYRRTGDDAIEMWADIVNSDAS